MLQNITLSAEAELIERARKIASERNTTLNAEFRAWLEMYAKREDGRRRVADLLRELGAHRTGGPFTRDEMNER